nr:unnamed protein product [Spirometra erinaceieuropaei]
MLNLHQESTAQKILTKNLREEERILRIRVAECTGDLKKNATFLDIQPGLLVRSSALETAVTMETQKSTVDTHQTLLNFACEEGDQYLKAKVLENHIYHRVLERLLMKFYNEPEGPYDNLHSQLSKAILKNFRDWRRWISYALSVLKTFDEYGLNRVQRDYGCIWRTQALELSANLIERKMTAERCIHEALINLRSAFDNSCSTTKDNNGEGRPKSESAEAEPGEDPSMNLRNSIQNIEYLLELFGGEEVLNLQAKIKDVRNNTHSWVDIIIEIFFNHMDTQDGKPHPEHRVFLRLIQVLEESLNEESTTLLGDNGVANCCTNVNKNLHLIVTNLIPIRHPCPTKSVAPETDVEASRNLLERLKLKAKSCIQDLVSALNLIEASMRDVDFSEYLHFHLPREETTRDKSAPWIDDSKRQKPANGTHTKFRSDQKINLQNALLILDNWMATLPQAIHTEFQMLEGEMDQLFAKNMHALCAFDASRVPQTTVGVKSALPERPLSSLDSNNSEPETPEAVKGLDEKFTRLESRVRKYTSDVISWQESDAANELNYVDHRDTTLRRRHLLQNEARSPARVGACGTVLKHATSVLETDLAYQLQCSLPKKFDELKAITESNLQLDTQLINAEAELKSLRDENALYSAELLRVEYEIGAVLGTTERITAMASEF